MWDRQLQSGPSPVYRLFAPRESPPDYVLSVSEAAMTGPTVSGGSGVLPFGKGRLALANRRTAGGKLAFQLNPAAGEAISDCSVVSLISASILPPRIGRKRMLAEIRRVLKRGGYATFCDAVNRGAALIEVGTGAVHCLGCVPGSLSEPEYEIEIRGAGLKAMQVETSHRRQIPEIEAWCAGLGFDYRAVAYPDGTFHSAMWTVMRR